MMAKFYAQAKPEAIVKTGTGRASPVVTGTLGLFRSRNSSTSPYLTIASSWNCRDYFAVVTAQRPHICILAFG